MGCGSGKLKSPGEGSILEYIAAGSVCCIGNLWAVSDAEINRFSKKLIEIWMESNLLGEIFLSESPFRKSLVAVDMSASVSRSRAACRLKHLIGAAPVTYGIPTRIQFTKPRK